jgi:phosphoglycolate phosphatase-like HAD superfamily hydrolase
MVRVMMFIKNIGILKPKVIIFDLDGTLVEMIPEHAVMLFCNFIQNLGLTPDRAKECYSKGYEEWCKVKDTLNGRKKYLKLWELCFRNIPTDVDPIKMAYTYQKIHEENCLDTLYTDVIPSLQLLHKRFKLGIFSERTSTAIRKCLDRHNLYGYFDFYVSASDIDAVNAKLSNKAWSVLIEKVNEYEWIDDDDNNNNDDDDNANANDNDNYYSNLNNNVLYIGDDYLTDMLNGYKHSIPSILIDRKYKYTNSSNTELVIITSLNELVLLMNE